MRDYAIKNTFCEVGRWITAELGGGVFGRGNKETLPLDWAQPKLYGMLGRKIA